jgi:phosphate transport system substrate-binding protein
MPPIELPQDVSFYCMQHIARINYIANKEIEFTGMKSKLEYWNIEMLRKKIFVPYLRALFRHSIIPSFQIFSLLLSIAVIFSSCGNNGKPTFTDTPTSGEIYIACDESYQPLMQAEADTFQEIYRYAKVHVSYLPEAEAFKQLLENDSIRLIVASRMLRNEEEEVFAQRQLIPRFTKVAIDAVALIVNNENADSLIKYQKLADIITGKISTWKELNPASPADSILIVFDRNGSSNTRYLKEKFLGKNSFPKNSYATNSNADVVSYVSNNKNALGVISVNWISDKDDATSNSFLKKVSVVQLSPPDSSKDAGEYFKPYQGYIALKQYPLIREVYIINREGRNGLGTGFAAFVAGDQGQRIIRLIGMLPATMPVRLIQTN